MTPAPAVDPPLIGWEAVTAYLTENDIPWEPGAREGEAVVTLPGECKLRVVVSLLVRPVTTSVAAFVVRNPDENHQGVYRYLLKRNLRLVGLAYAIDDSGDVYVRGTWPTRGLDTQAVDQLLGAVLEASDRPFNELLALGFLESMRKEWAWRVSRGESTRNLDAFRHLLEPHE